MPEFINSKLEMDLRASELKKPASCSNNLAGFSVFKPSERVVNDFMISLALVFIAVASSLS